MVTLLAKLFNKNDASEAAQRQSIGTACGLLGILLNLLLFGAKLTAAALTGAVSIRADAFNNLSDAGTSLVTLVGFLLARQRPDPEHPFGHGRMEYISGLAVAMAVLLMGFSLLQTSAEKIAQAEAVSFSLLSTVILAGAIAVKLVMFGYNRKYGKKTNSPALLAAASDSLSDTLATGAALCQHFFGWQIDGYVGLMVSLFILFTGIKTVRETIAPLLGQSPSAELIHRIQQIVLASPIILGMHDLVVHDYGPGRMMISLHAEVPAEGDLLEMHDAIDNTERALTDALGCSAVIHMDPIVTSDEKTADMRMRVGELVKAIDEQATFHDFRMVEGPTHTNLIFDIVLPYNAKVTDAEAKQRIAHMVHALEGNYFAIVGIDREYAPLATEASK